MIFRYTLPDGPTREFEGEHEAEAWLERNRECWALGLDPKAFPITTDAGLTNVELELVRAEIAKGETDAATIAARVGVEHVVGLDALVATETAAKGKP